jgi:hypothetical protein
MGLAYQALRPCCPAPGFTEARFPCKRPFLVCATPISKPRRPVSGCGSWHAWRGMTGPTGEGTIETVCYI